MDIISEIERIGTPTRQASNLERRGLKAVEEVGELAEALLGASLGEDNYKGKTWEHVLEEAVDVALMGIDIALTAVPPDEEWSREHWELKVRIMFEDKLRKWEEKIASGQTFFKGETK